MFAVPILEGLCTYGDVYKLSLDDFVIMNEIVDVKHHNDDVMYKESERKAKANRG